MYKRPASDIPSHGAPLPSDAPQGVSALPKLENGAFNNEARKVSNVGGTSTAATGIEMG